jgi:hypothetical protein
VTRLTHDRTNVSGLRNWACVKPILVACFKAHIILGAVTVFESRKRACIRRDADKTLAFPISLFAAQPK